MNLFTKQKKTHKLWKQASLPKEKSQGEGWIGGSGLALLWQIPSSPALQRISSGDSPVAVVYQLQQLCGCSGSALLPGEKPSEHSESWRTQVYYASGLRGDRSPESEPGRRVSQGFYGLHLPGPSLASWTGVTSGKVVDAETIYSSRCMGEDWLGQLARLCLVIMAGVSPFYILLGHFLLQHMHTIVWNG